MAVGVWGAVAVIVEVVVTVGEAVGVGVGVGAVVLVGWRGEWSHLKSYLINSNLITYQEWFYYFDMK